MNTSMTTHQEVSASTSIQLLALSSGYRPAFEPCEDDQCYADAQNRSARWSNWPPTRKANVELRFRKTGVSPLAVTTSFSPAATPLSRQTARSTKCRNCVLA